MKETIAFTSLTFRELQQLIEDSMKETLQTLDLYKPQQATEPKQILSRKETADMLNISLPTLHSYTQQGLIKAVRIGCSVRYRIEDVFNSLTLINVGGKKA